MTTPYQIRPVGYVESPLVDRETTPKQGLEAFHGTPIVDVKPVLPGGR
jgi:tRNA (Thr-GGU) A37 N-methylase